VAIRITDQDRNTILCIMTTENKDSCIQSFQCVKEKVTKAFHIITMDFGRGTAYKMRPWCNENLYSPQ